MLVIITSTSLRLILATDAVRCNRLSNLNLVPVFLCTFVVIFVFLCNIVFAI